VGDSSQGHIGVNEGPEALIHNGRVFVVYSGNGCWTDNYALGLIFADKGKDLLDAAAWHKYAGPVFRQGNSAVYAPGHNAFFRSPDGTEDWILYHANAAAGKGCAGERSPRAQRFRWKPDGFPDFGVPIAPGKAVRVPSERLESGANGRAGRRRPAHPSR
jgi:GH43 family beta-xylosidase